MCLIAFAWRAHPAHELLLAANRDEFHDRPTRPAGYWQEAPEVYGGRDLQAGGSWLALSTRRRLACVTNVRRMAPPDPAAPSRGQLVTDFLLSTLDAEDFARSLKEKEARYAGFNLLLWDGASLRYVTNRPAFRHEDVAPGLHALSNASLDTPWPKVRRVRGALEDWLAHGAADEQPLIHALSDRDPAAAEELPDTGVGPAFERLLSPPFILSPRYGTRSTSLVSIGAGHAMFRERRYDAEGRLLGDDRSVLRLIQS